ncbi:hypothetical protein P872_24535 [Rhodonellum psychrophilum GCM71 = DSM 17998]|uniref:Uncharacterized protein n=1 Tax=Rhodonellum psychrophilum GCM71 = DSM 17998 TaxID=1123057 RepID=U5C3E6_9BACT|nr:hypothetical protein P872_24535 [Rhodonellum psychrophilum GCM71 = DSM 17998]
MILEVHLWRLSSFFKIKSILKNKKIKHQDTKNIFEIGYLIYTKI